MLQKCWTSYYLAAKLGHDSVLLVLIPLWSDVDMNEKEVLYKALMEADDDDSLTPLHVAAREGLVTVVKAFISVGADLEHADKVSSYLLLCLAYPI